MIVTAGVQTVATMKDVVDFVLFPLIILLASALLTFSVWIVRKLQDHSEALALVLHEVNPANAPSLRDQLQAIKLDVATIKAQPSNHGNP